MQLSFVVATLALGLGPKQGLCEGVGQE